MHAARYGLDKTAKALLRRGHRLNDLDRYPDDTGHFTWLCGGVTRTWSGFSSVREHMFAYPGEFQLLMRFARRVDSRLAKTGTDVKVSMVEDLLNRGAEIANAEGDCTLLVHAAR